MDGGGDKGDRFRCLQHLDEAFIIDRLVEEIDDIDRVLVHAVKKDVRGIEDNAHGHIRVLFMEFL